ncbi:major facilitator superfamily protein [Stylonychia lemnae]|uniref:Major facilitator superfamily protein n=1 Tax=Stylonychia lemnae TaxID=5949 RepID=A0A078BEQ1_STYLE|nr:major facilitator superfamily protein [Stylonychia lemnae]|eukprot:CDW91637.1 major facilitator superfamily protein [Stylonychia lemnae]
MISSKIMNDFGYDSLGFYSLGLTNLFFGFSSPFTSNIIDKYGSKLAIKVGSVTFFLNVLASLLPTIKNKYQDLDIVFLYKEFIYSSVLICAAINGFGNSLLWCGSSIYVTKCSNLQTKERFFAFLQGIPQFSQFFGCLMSAFLLGNLDTLTFFIIMAAITGFGSFLLFLLREPLPQMVSIEQNSIVIENKEEENEVANDDDSLLPSTVQFSIVEGQPRRQTNYLNPPSFNNRDHKSTSIFPEDNNSTNNRQIIPQNNQLNTKNLSKYATSQNINSTDNSLKSSTTVTQSLSGMFRLLITRKMLILCAYMVQAGFTNAFQSAIFFPMLNDTMDKSNSKQKSSELSMFVLAACGLGEVLGAFSISLVIKQFKSNRMGVLYHLILSTLGYSCLIVYAIMFEFNPLAFVFALIFGMMDGASSTHLGLICGFEFDSQSVFAMGVNYMVKPIFGFIIILIESGVDATSSSTLTIFYSVSYAVCLICILIILFVFPFKPWLNRI